MRRLRALLTGYAAVRPLLPVEKKHFLAFMRLTMLCNCTWRFVNFNVENRQIESCLNAHVELQERIVALYDDITVAAVEGLLKTLPTAPTLAPPFFGKGAPTSSPATPSDGAHGERVAKVALTVAAMGVAALAVGVAVSLARRRA